MRLMQLSFIYLMWLCQFSPAFAQPWHEQIPSALAPFSGQAQQLAKLTGDGILIYSHPEQKLLLPTFQEQRPVSAQFYSAALVVPASAMQVQQILLDFKNYHRLFPTLKSVTRKTSAQGIPQYQYQVHIPTPIPVLNFKESIMMQHHHSAHKIASLVISAPLPYGVGQLEWFDLGDNHTLITLTQWADLNHSKGFLVGQILKALPDVKLGLPTSVNAFLMEALQDKFKSHTPLLQADFPEPIWNTAQWQQISTISQKSNTPVGYIHPKILSPYLGKNEPLRFSSSYLYLPEKQNRLETWIQPAALQPLFPSIIRQANFQKIDAQQQNAHYKVSVGLGVIRIPFHFHLRFQQLNAHQTQFYATSGDIKTVKGKMQLIAHEQGTLLKLTSSIKIDQDAPFLIRAMRSLPYHEMLPALGGNTVYALKVRNKVK